MNRVAKDKDEARYKPEVFLHPMRKWHLYSDFKNGVNIGGRIQFVWLFGRHRRVCAPAGLHQLS
jgi:hypothetical protein